MNATEEQVQPQVHTTTATFAQQDKIRHEQQQAQQPQAEYPDKKRSQEQQQQQPGQRQQQQKQKQTKPAAKAGTERDVIVIEDEDDDNQHAASLLNDIPTHDLSSLAENQPTTSALAEEEQSHNTHVTPTDMINPITDDEAEAIQLSLTPPSPDLSQTHSDTQTQTQASTRPKRGSWTCSVCTFLNPPPPSSFKALVRCAVCKAPRPGKFLRLLPWL